MLCLLAHYISSIVGKTIISCLFSSRYGASHRDTTGQHPPRNRVVSIVKHIPIFSLSKLQTDTIHIPMGSSLQEPTLLSLSSVQEPNCETREPGGLGVDRTRGMCRSTWVCEPLKSELWLCCTLVRWSRSGDLFGCSCLSFHGMSVLRCRYCVSLVTPEYSIQSTNYSRGFKVWFTVEGDSNSVECIHNYSVHHFS